MRTKRSRWLMAGTLVAGLPWLVGTAQAAPTPGQRCQSGKNTAAGNYSVCRQKAEAKFALALDSAKRTQALARCQTKLQSTWATLEAKALAQGAFCPSMGDLTRVQAALDEQTTTLATSLDGSGEPTPPQARRLKTGQTRCYEGVLPFAQISCAGTGQDGEFQRGVARAYRDPGVGTVEDTRTGLTWEKQSWDSSIHDHNFEYTWDGAAAKIATLNATAFAGFTDWRLPNRAELESLLSAAHVGPAVDPSFNVSCVAGCTVLTCSCTISEDYWTSTTLELLPGLAWEVEFGIGFVRTEAKSTSLHVRAVRGGV